MIKIDNKHDCCGCSACASICPNKCIMMSPDKEGFLYPSINEQFCNNCGLCTRICPFLNLQLSYEGSLAYVVQLCNNDEALYHSASGGAFTAIATKVIKIGGYVYGAAYNNDFVVEHVGTKKLSEISRFRSSKYVQSNPKDCFIEVKQLLDNGEKVCYSGTPCQIGGLKSFLRRDYDNLITVDVVCKGVGSPEVLRQYIEIMKKNYNSRIVRMNFKRKTYGYHSSTMSIDFENGKSYSRGGITDFMMRSFRTNICLRPSCSNCAFKSEKRVSDFTIFDCWHYKELTGLRDDDRGHTNVLIHSEKGRKLFESLEDSIKKEEIEKELAIKLDGMMICNAVKFHPKRTLFFNDLYLNGLEEAIKFNIPISTKEKLADASKGLLYKLHFMKIAKKLFKTI